MILISKYFYFNHICIIFQGLKKKGIILHGQKIGGHGRNAGYPPLQIRLTNSHALTGKTAHET